MEMNDLILISAFCVAKRIDTTMIYSMEETGLVEIIRYQGENYFSQHTLPKVEKIIQLHIDLQLDFESLEIISGLLDKIESLQEENRLLRRQIGRR